MLTGENIPFLLKSEAITLFTKAHNLSLPWTSWFQTIPQKRARIVKFDPIFTGNFHITTCYSCSESFKSDRNLQTAL